MKLQVELELADVFGGDGVIRTEIQKKVKLNRTKRRIESRTDINLPLSDDERHETNEEEKEIAVQTFRMNENGKPMMRLGGMHGKIYGALRDSAQTLKMLGEHPFTSQYKRILDSILITPIWVELETNGEKMETQELPQILSGMKRTMIIQKYDVIPKSNAKFYLTFPDALELAVRKLIRALEMIGMLNKRRATCKVKEVIAC